MKKIGLNCEKTLRWKGIFVKLEKTRGLYYKKARSRWGSGSDPRIKIPRLGSPAGAAR
jgi:hypothetical protein